jgi:RNase P protein component
MFKTIFRLKWKEVNFLVRKRQYFSTKFFGFFYYNQYPNLKFNQISVNIPLKYNKRAVSRVQFKRLIVNFLQKNDFVKKDINNSFYKIFITINKKNIWELKSQIEKFDKQELNHYIIKEFKDSFLKFSKKLWN